jgi:hypothetical protein
MSSENQRNALAKIPGGCFCIVDSLYFDQGLILVLLVVSSPETEECGFDPESLVKYKHNMLQT